jgi:hypothetical protein
MLARHEFAACAASSVTLDVVVAERSHGEASPSEIVIPEWCEFSFAWAHLDG